MIKADVIFFPSTTPGPREAGKMAKQCTLKISNKFWENNDLGRGTTLDTGNAKTKDTVPALNEYFLPEQTDKKINDSPIILYAEICAKCHGSRGGRRTQTGEIRGDFLKQSFVPSETPWVRAKVKFEDIGNNIWKTIEPRKRIAFLEIMNISLRLGWDGGSGKKWS